MSVRSVPLVAGVVAFAAGVAVLAGVWTLGLTRRVILLVAVASLLLACSGLLRRYDVRDRRETPDPERRYHVPVPGGDRTRAAEAFLPDRGSTYATRGRFADGLYRCAVAVLTRFRGRSEDEARTQLDAGTWTDDPDAAAFLSDSVEPPRRSLRERLTDRFVRNVTYEETVRRTVAAIVAVGDDPSETDAPIRAPRYEDEAVEAVADRTTDRDVDGIVERASRRTGHWAGIGFVSLVAIGAGVFTESAAVLIAGVVGVGYAGFANALEAPEPILSIERQFDGEDPEPGDEVGVTVTITNESGRLLPDVRFVDGVPSGLVVTDGVARLGTALRPDESVTLEYTLEAHRGRHAFDPALVLTRDLSRSAEREFLLESRTTLTCEPTLRPLASPVPLRATAATFSGRLTTSEGGAGTQFHSVREYRKNDPLNRIDWNRHARTGELATLQFHEERAARVLVLVDARKAAYLAPEPDAAHAVERSVAAAGRIATTLLDDGDTVGLAAIGPYYDREDGDESDGSPEPCWLAPGSGHHHRARFRRLLGSHPQLSARPPTTASIWQSQLRRIHRRLSSDTQVILLTPLCDRASASITRWLDARGHAVTVVSPDPTADRTVGQQLAGVDRRIRRFDLRRAAVPVVDWPDEESIDDAFARLAALDRTAAPATVGGGP